MNPRRLYKTRNRQLAGVAGGMAEYLDIDPTVMRILWILVGLFTAGFAIVAYIVLAIVIPDAPWAPTDPAAGAWGQGQQAPNPGWSSQTTGWATAPQAPAAPAGQGWASYPPAPAGAAPASGWATAGAAPASAYAATGTAPAATSGAYPAPQPRAESRRFGAAAIVGVVLIVIGGIALADALIPGWVAPAALGPAILIAIGAAFVVSAIGRAPRGADNGGATTAGGATAASPVPPIPPASAAASTAERATRPALIAAPSVPVAAAAADEAETTAIAVPIVDAAATGVDPNRA